MEKNNRVRVNGDATVISLRKNTSVKKWGVILKVNYCDVYFHNILKYLRKILHIANALN